MRKNIIRSIFTLCLCTTAGSTHAQLGFPKEYVEPPGWSLGMTVGLADLWGDVGTQSVIDHYANGEYWNKIHAMGGVFGRYCAHPALAVRLGVNYGVLYANDKWNKTKAEKAVSIEDDAYQRYARNQSVKSNTWEFNFLFELNPLRLGLESKTARRRWQPYLLAGVGYFHFQPKAKLVTAEGIDKGWVNLYDLNLEGNGFDKNDYLDAPEKYSRWQLCIPMGIGMKWDMGRQLALGVEYLYRMTMTDYLDNVSYKYIDPALYDKYLTVEQAEQAKLLSDKSFLLDIGTKNKPGDIRGNPAVKDAYSTFSITLIYKIKSKKMPWWF